MFYQVTFSFANITFYSPLIGTKILTDGWGGYNDLPNLGYQREKVNHSKV